MSRMFGRAMAFIRKIAARFPQSSSAPQQAHIQPPSVVAQHKPQSPPSLFSTTLSHTRANPRDVVVIDDETSLFDDNDDRIAAGVLDDATDVEARRVCENLQRWRQSQLQQHHLSELLSVSRPSAKM